MTFQAHYFACLCIAIILLPCFGQESVSGYSGPKDKLHVYLLIGGRNMAGTAPLTEADKSVLDRCYLLNKDNTWEAASAPLNRFSTVLDKDADLRLGLGLSFAKKMLEARPDISIGLIVNAKEESPISDWARKGKVYWAARKRMKMAQNTGLLKGVLMHQGEDDLQSPEGYLDKLMDFIAFFRTFLFMPDLPFVVGGIADGGAINKQLATLPARVHSSGYVSPEGLKAAEERRFDKAATIELGERYATTMLKLQNAQTDLSHESAAGTKIIDAHIHANSCNDGGLEALAQWMKENNVQVSIVHPLNHKGSRPENEEIRQKMLASYRKFPSTIFRFTVFEPDEVNTIDEAVARLEKEKADGAIGFGEHYGRGLHFDDPGNKIIYAACEKVGLPVLFHIDGNKNMVEPGMKRLENILREYPKCVLIAHSQWWFQLPDGTCDRLLKTYPNLYADLSPNAFTMLNRDRGYSKEFLTRHADRMLFGTDAGWWSFGKGKPRHMEFTLLERLGLPNDVKEKIYHKNAERLFGLKGVSSPADH